MIQHYAEIMEQQGHDGTEGVEEQVTKEMKEALEGNGFIKGTIEMATRAAMAVMKGEVFEGMDGDAPGYEPETPAVQERLGLGSRYWYGSALCPREWAGFG